MAKGRVSGPHKRLYNLHRGKKPRRETRRFCPDCGAILAPGKECNCLYEISADIRERWSVEEVQG